MKIEPLTPGDLQTLLRIERAPDGGVTPAAIARLVRGAVQRWGVCAAGEVTRYVRQQAEAVGASASVDLVNEVRDRLIALGDIGRARSEGRPVLTRTPLKLVHLGDSMIAALGTVELPVEAERAIASVRGEPQPEGEGPFDPLAALVRRVQLDETVEVALRDAGAQWVTIDEWWAATARDEEMGAGAALHLERRGGTEGAPLARLWDRLAEALEGRGTPGAAAEDVWILAGTPGGHFGKPPDVGRWRSAMLEGTWCGRRRGPTELAPKPPVLVRVAEGRPARLLDLHDEHEFVWAVLARGAALGDEEQVSFDEETGRVQFHFPPPAAVARLMHLLGARVSAFGWCVPPRSRPVWRAFLGLDGGSAR